MENRRSHAPPVGKKDKLADGMKWVPCPAHIYATIRRNPVVQASKCASSTAERADELV
jgi:hypothetical protein